MEREGFVFYRSFYDALKGMEAEMCKACFVALCEYGLNGNDNTDDPVAAAILAMARPTIEKNNHMYENGKKGGRPKNQTKPNENQIKPNETKTNQPETKQKPTETETVTETDKKSVSRAKKPPFAPPSLEEVRAYCQERGNKVDAERFIDYYTSNGWKVGKNSMKDWKAAVRNWEKQDAERLEGQSGVRQQGASNQKQNRFINYQQSEHDFDWIERMEREQREKW